MTGPCPYDCTNKNPFNGYCNSTVCTNKKYSGASFINIEEMRPTYCTSCLICGAIIEEYNDPPSSYPRICDECKAAVLFAKRLKDGEK